VLVCVLGSAAVLIGAVHNLLFAPTSHKSYRTVNHESERYGQLDVCLVLTWHALDAVTRRLTNYVSA